MQRYELNTGLITRFGMLFEAVACDLIDARGHTFPLLLQFRHDADSRREYNATGVLLSRDSAHTVLATITRRPNRWSAALEMSDESARFFATYAPHGDGVEAKDVECSELSPVHDGKAAIKRSRDGREWVVARTISQSDRKAKWVSLWATVNQPGGACDHASAPDSEVLVTQIRERGHVVLEELRTLCCAAGELRSLQPEEYSMFSAYHPPAVVRSFTVAALSPILL